MFIVNIANNLFQNIFQRHDTAQIAIFIDDNGEMFPPLAESLKLVKQQRCLRDEIRVAGDILDKLAPAIATNTAAAMLANSAQQILDVKNANNVVRVARIDRVARMRGFQHAPQQRLQVIIGIHHAHTGPMRHDLVDRNFVQIQHRRQHGLRFAVIGITVCAMQFDHAAQLFLAITVIGLALADQPVCQHPQSDRQRAEYQDNSANGRRNGKRIFVGIGQCIGFRHDLGKNHKNNRHHNGGPQHACLVKQRDKQRCGQRRSNDIDSIIADQD